MFNLPCGCYCDIMHIYLHVAQRFLICLLLSPLRRWRNHYVKGCTHRAMVLCMGPSIGIKRNNLNPSHSGNTYPVRFTAILDAKKLLKSLAMALDQYLTCQVFLLRWAHLPIKTSRIAQWVYGHPPIQTAHPCLIMVCGDPESGTDHSLKEISANIILVQGNAKRYFLCTSVYIYKNIHVSVKNSSAEGTCILIL